MIIRKIEELRAWATLADYDAAKERASREIEERLSRGNTASQNGSSMERDELTQLSCAADQAMRRIAAYLPPT